MPLSLFSLESLVHHLSSHTWGLSVTLNDLENLTQYENIEKTLTNNLITTTKSPALNLPPNISHTIRLCTRFLRHLNFILSPESQDPKGKSMKSFENNSTQHQQQQQQQRNSNNSTLNKTKNEFSNGFATIVRNETHRGLDRNESGLQFLCFLGLTHSKLSRESIDLLEVFFLIILLIHYFHLF